MDEERKEKEGRFLQSMFQSGLHFLYPHSIRQHSTTWTNSLRRSLGNAGCILRVENRLPWTQNEVTLPRPTQLMTVRDTALKLVELLGVYGSPFCNCPKGYLQTETNYPDFEFQDASPPPHHPLAGKIILMSSKWLGSFQHRAGLHFRCSAIWHRH